uniref:Chromatin assembly factor 1, subunit A (p150) n=1 Tax=Cyprinus carpio TaxID=7962 RepID=A0A8C1ZRQ8_CYPCA
MTRLPFKRLNPEPKECNEPKRTKGPVAPKSSEPSASDGENEMDNSSTPLHHGPALINGRGPLDCFMSRQKRSPVRSGPEATIDLTEDSNDAVRQQPAPPVATTCPLSEETTKNAEHATKATEPTVPLTNKEAEEDEDALPLLDITQDSDTEEEEQQETEVSHGNESVLSTGSTSSLSVVESSPEPSKSAPTTPASVSRHELMLYRLISSFSVQEQEEKRQRKEEKERQKEEAKAAKERKKEEARKLKEEKEREKKEKKEKDEKERREKKEREEKEKAEKLRLQICFANCSGPHCVCASVQRIKAEKAEITRFLQKPKTQLAPKILASACGKFAPFEIKANMSLAKSFFPLDTICFVFDTAVVKICHRHSPIGKYVNAHAQYFISNLKFLSFQELLDYEVDSDEEWEEEEPGESLSHSEGDDDDEGGDDDDDDDGFFVPHGYLSEGEGALEEDEEGGDPEKQKVRQRMKAREWENELMSKGKVRVLEAVVRGCLWDGEEPALDLLQPYAICMLEPLPRDEPCTPEQDLSRQQRNERLLSQLLPLLHGNVNSSKVIINEFLEFCRQQASSPTGSFTDSVPPRIHVRRIIKEHAVYEKRSTYRRCCWYVHPEVLARHSQEALPVPCQWTYLTSGAQITRDEHAGSQGNSPNASSSTTPSNKRKSASSHSITKYMKKCGDSEQTEAMETDGFQADTEDDEDDDCIIVGEQSGSSEQDANTSLQQTERNTEPMDTNASETAALALPCLTPATA